MATQDSADWHQIDPRPKRPIPLPLSGSGRAFVVHRWPDNVAATPNIPLLVPKVPTATHERTVRHVTEPRYFSETLWNAGITVACQTPLDSLSMSIPDAWLTPPMATHDVVLTH